MGVTLPFQRLEPFSVEIGFDLSRPMAPSEAYHFNQLFREHSLLVARGQNLTIERQHALCGLLGPILDREGESGILSNDSPGPSQSAFAWHADAAYTEHPLDAISLHAIDVVEDASVTMFVNAQRACTELPDGLRAAIAGREQEMISPHYTCLHRRACDTRDSLALRRAVMPAIRRNPHNGSDCLWVSELHSVRLQGMQWEDSQDLLLRLFDHLYRPETVRAHRWRNGDIVIWDNIALQHSRGNLEDCGKRVLQRVIVGSQGAAPHITENSRLS